MGDGLWGEWLWGLAKKLSVCSAYIEGLYGVYEGFNLARILGFRAFEVNVGSQLVMTTINNNNSGSPMARDLVTKIKSFLMQVWEVVVSHMYYEISYCADDLARSGINLIEAMYIFYLWLLEAHLLGIFVPSLVSV